MAINGMQDAAMADAQHTTNYRNTFIQVADDCPADRGLVPPERGGALTVAGLQYAMLAGKPYAYTSDDVIFAASAAGRSLGGAASKAKISEARAAFFSKGQACLRASPLGKTFGWGIHADAEGRVALFAMDSAGYRRLAKDPQLKQLKAMRSKRA
jgi:hypothetical protein